jgi:hypothetical protein
VLAPYSTWSTKAIDLWDFASIGGLSRSVLELRLTFYYLCVEKCAEDEWRARRQLLDLHDCVSRLKLFEDMGDAAEVASFSVVSETLRDRLRGNAFFKALPAGNGGRDLNPRRRPRIEPLST